MILLASLIAILIESSLLPLPGLLWVVWYGSNKIQIGRLVWIAVLGGILLDILSIRMVGLSAILLWGFVLGLSAIRQFSAGGNVERFWVIGCSALWAYTLGGVRGGLMIVVIGLSLVVLIFKEEGFRGIRLKT